MAKTASQKFSEGPWFVYILLCKGGSLYTGICKNTEKRFNVHVSGRGAKYTRIYKPIYFVHIEEYSTHNEAFQRELTIKSFSRSKKEKLKNLL